MSAPEAMPCLGDACEAPLACSHSGSCRLRQRDAAASYDLAISAMRSSRITGNKTALTEDRSAKEER